MFNFLPSPSLERTVNNWHYQVAFGKSSEQSAHLLHPQECIASLPNWISHSSSSFSITLLSYHLGKKKNTGFLRLIVRVKTPPPPHLTVRGVTGLGLSPKEYQFFLPLPLRDSFTRKNCCSFLFCPNQRAFSTFICFPHNCGHTWSAANYGLYYDARQRS